MSAAKLCVCVCVLTDFRMMGTQVLVFKLKFENFIYHKIKISTGGAYAPCIRAYFKEIYGLHNSAHVRHFMKNREVASAKGAKLRLPKARSSLRLGGLRSVVSSPSGVWGGAPENDAILNILCQNGVHFWLLLISYFLT